MRYDIIFKNEHFIAVNKPAGLLSIPDRMGQDVSLKLLLQQQYGQVFTVHRLDKDTSGVILFALTEQAHADLSQLFEGRSVAKFYRGLVAGKPMHEKGTIEAAITEHPGKQTKMMTHAKGKPSITDYEVLETFGNYTWMQFQIHTGRTHQIRVHMQYMGNPIACDELYGNGEPLLVSALKGKKFKLSANELEERPLLSRLALHSYQLQFVLYGESFDLVAPLPKDLRATLQQLTKWKSR